MKIAIFGTGYVGLVTGACLADKGHQVHCIDISEEKIALLKQATPPFYEPGLKELLQRGVDSGRLTFSTTPDISGAQVIFIAVGTPQSPNGSADLSAVFAVAHTIKERCTKGQVVVTKSTVPVGTAHILKTILGEDIYVASNPETLREGAAIQDFMSPDRIIVGAEDKEAFDALREVYSPFLIRDQNRIQEMNCASAELVKYGANTMLAMRISFINLLSQLCTHVGADIRDVRQGIGSDYRIGMHFLYPGPGFGGSCFPKDVSSLAFQLREAGVDPALVSATLSTNSAQQHHITRTILEHTKDSEAVGLWGLAFKANTDDVRDSASIFVSQQLLKHQKKLYVHDPQATHNYLKVQPHATTTTRQEMLKEIDVLVILTEWNEYRTLTQEELTLLQGKTIVDARNLLAREAELKKLREHNITYVGVGMRAT